VNLNLTKNSLLYFPSGVCSLSKLETLYLGRNNIAYIPECFGQLKQLKTLDFWDNPLSDIPKSIENLKNLTYVDLRGINFSSSKKSQISELIPWVTIDFSAGCDCHGP
jgi:Leucine-rich repeat (LRR) protein